MGLACVPGMPIVRLKIGVSREFCPVVRPLRRLSFRARFVREESAVSGLSKADFSSQNALGEAEFLASLEMTSGPAWPKRGSGEFPNEIGRGGWRPVGR